MVMWLWLPQGGDVLADIWAGLSDGYAIVHYYLIETEALKVIDS